MPPTPSEAARASLSQCFQKALATPRTKPAPPPEQSRGLTKGGPAQYSLAHPFAGINLPPPEVLRESHSDQPARGRAATPLEWPPEEKKRRSSSHPQGEADQSTASLVVLSPPGTSPKLEGGNPTEPVLNPLMNRRLRHLRQC